ncbi:MAG: hypothetical protein GF313_14065 [Caldithrix sp.]|nr:hypothetical protein [Caldithrix sp.]
MKFRKRMHLVAIFMLFIIRSAWSQERADYIIVENPQPLIVYDQFQRRVDTGRLKIFSTYVPLKVIRENDLFSDRISRVMGVELFSRRYHIMQNESGGLVNESDAGYVKRFNNCTIRNDTIEVLHDNRIRLYNRPATADDHIIETMDRETHLKRIFSKNGYHYVAELGIVPQYGWVRLPRTSAWTFLRKRTSSKMITLPVDIQNQIEQRLATVNQKYQTYFRSFNRIHQSSKPIPQWKKEPVEKGLKYRLDETGYMDRLNESTYYLVQDLQNMLVGTSFEVIHNADIIVIQPKNQ